MAERDLWLDQENSSGKYVRVILSPTAAQHSLSFNSSGVPVVTAASSPIADSSITASTVTPSAVAPSVSYDQTEATQVVTDLNLLVAEFNKAKADLDSISTKLNSTLALLRTHNTLQT